MASKAQKVDRPKNLHRIRIGKRGEELAVTFLLKQGFTILERNWRKNFGEIDIIAMNKGEHRMIEVKTRMSERMGTALESISDQKLGTIDQLAQRYFYEKGMVYPKYHIDVVTIDVNEEGRATLRYFPDIQ